MVGTSKQRNPYLGPFWVHFSFLLDNFLGFLMESAIIVSSVNPPKNFRCPYFREEGGGQAGYQNVFIFYVLIMVGREGFKANKSNVFYYYLFF